MEDIEERKFKIKNKKIKNINLKPSKILISSNNNNK